MISENTESWVAPKTADPKQPQQQVIILLFSHVHKSRLFYVYIYLETWMPDKYSRARVGDECCCCVVLITCIPYFF